MPTVFIYHEVKAPLAPWTRLTGESDGPSQRASPEVLGNMIERATLERSARRRVTQPTPAQGSIKG